MAKIDFSFELITQSDKARLGRIKTPKGIVETPAFMPVGTQGTIKGVLDDVEKTNTYNLRKHLSFTIKTWNRIN